VFILDQTLFVTTQNRYADTNDNPTQTVWRKYMTALEHPRLVTVFGGSGFIGRHTVRALAAKGHRIRVACRRPDLAQHLQPLGTVGQIQLVQANVRYRWSVDRAVQGSNAVVNLVGIAANAGKQTLGAVNGRGAGWVAQAAAQNQAPLVHISALGANRRSGSDYARTKMQGEKLVRESAANAIVLRPSVVFGPEDQFFNKLAALARLMPVAPLIGGGTTKLQPVYAGDVGAAIAKAVDGQLAPRSTWELGGPEILTSKQCLERILAVSGRKKPMVSFPLGLASLKARFAQFLPGAPLTPGLVEMLRIDSTVSPDMEANKQTLAGMGINATTLASILPSYLVRFRKYGQFETNRGL